MIRNIPCLILLSSILLFSHCGQDCTEENDSGRSGAQTEKDCKTENALLAKEVIIRHNFSISNTENPEWLANLNSEALIGKIFEKVLSGETEAMQAEYIGYHSCENKTLTIQELALAMGIDKPEGQENLEEKILEKSGQVQKLMFVESWVFDRKAFKLYKIPKNLHIVREFQKNGDEEKINRLVFKIPYNTEQFDEEEPPLLASDVKYEFGLFNEDFYSFIQDSEEWRKRFEIWYFRKQEGRRNFNGQKFVDIILEEVMAGNVIAYCPNTGDALSMDQIKNVFGALKDTVAIHDPVSGEITDHRIINESIHPEEVNTVIFTEDWFFDEATLYLVKRVKEITLVRRYFDNTAGTMVIKEVLTVKM